MTGRRTSADTGRAMSQENVEVVRVIHDAFDSGDYEAALSCMDEEVELFGPPDISGGDDAFRGHEGVRRGKFVARNLGQLSVRVARPDRRRRPGVDDRLAHRRGRRSGVEVSEDFFMVWTVRYGRVVGLRMFRDRREALEAAGRGVAAYGPRRMRADHGVGAPLDSPPSSRLAFRWSPPPGSDGVASSAARLGTVRSDSAEAPCRDATTTSLEIPQDLKPVRRPLRLRARPRSGPSSSPRWPARRGDVMGTSHRQAPVKDVVGRVRSGLRDLFRAARRLRGRARQRRHDRVLGRRRLRPHPRARAAPDVRRVLPEVRQGHGGRAVPRRPDRRLAPTPATRPTPVDDDAVDVVAWAHNETSTGVMLDVSARAQGDVARPRSTPRRAPAACPLDAAQADVYYFAPQKCFASDGGLWLALMSPAALERIEEIAAQRTAGSPSPCRSPRRWTTRARTRPTTRPRSRRCSCSPTRSSGCSPTAAWSCCVGAHQRVLGAPVRAGPRRRAFATPFVADHGQALARRRHDRLRRRGRRGRGRGHAAGQRDRRHRAVPQARAQPAAHRHVPGDRARRRQGADRVHRLRRGGPVMTRVLVAEKIGDSRHRSAARSTSTSTSASTGRDGELADAIGGYDGLLIRSATKLDGRAHRARHEPQGDRPGRRRRRQRRRRRPRPSAASSSPTRPQSNVVTAAEHTMALLLALARNVPQAHASLIAGKWERSKFSGIELHDKTLGILGFGRIGQLVAQRAKGFGMRVARLRPVRERRALPRAGRREGRVAPTTSTRSPTSSPCTCPRPPRPRTGSTPRRFAKMKDGVRVLNVARGPLIVDERPPGRARLGQGRRRRARRVPHRAGHRAPAVRLPQRDRHAAPRRLDRRGDRPRRLPGGRAGRRRAHRRRRDDAR